MSPLQSYRSKKRGAIWYVGILWHALQNYETNNNPAPTVAVTDKILNRSKQYLSKNPETKLTELYCCFQRLSQ